MAQIPYRANLQTMSFPMLSELSGRTIIAPQQDQTYQRGVSGEGQTPLEIGIPQIFYGHNIMPSTQGFQSVGYNLIYSGFQDAVDLNQINMQNAQLIYGAYINSDNSLTSSNVRTYITMGYQGAAGVFILDVNTKKWKRLDNSPATTSTTKITVATINGYSYIFFSNIGAYVWDSTNSRLSPRTLTGTQASNLLGILSSNGYLFAWGETSVAWSSTIDPQDFTPSTTTGAGGGSVQEAKGKIVTARVTSVGLILFTEVNAVSVIYTGNINFPWTFKAIPSSGGVSSSDLVSQEQAAGYHQMYSTNGIQQVANNRCNTVTPNVTDFIAGKKFEDFIISTGEFVETVFTWVMRKKLSVIADRYVVISYGLSPTEGEELTHAIVLDIAQGRMGKLRVNHTSCFELHSLTTNNEISPRESIAFLTRKGDIKVVDFSLGAKTDDAVIILGKYQYVRSRFIELHQVEAENVDTDSTFILTALSSLNGKTTSSREVGFLEDSDPDLRSYYFSKSQGKNISLQITGPFNLISLVLTFSTTGQN